MAKSGVISSDTTKVRLRRLLAGLLILALLAIPAPAVADSEVTVSGGGWGHGIGMSQYGAKDLADDGMTAQNIIKYFYTGVSIGTVGNGSLTGHADPLWIGLLQDKSIIQFKAVGGPIDLCLGADCSLTVPAGQQWSIQWVSGEVGKCRFHNAAGTAVGSKADCEGSLTWSGQPDVGIYLPATGDTYGRGEILIKPALAGRFNMVVELGLEEYLYGLAEMPSSWHTQALRAQAIAGRTYALYKAWVWRALESNQTRMDLCACHLYATTFDQKYVGLAKETEVVGSTNYGAKWVAAVDATAGQAATHSASFGRAIQAYYFSSSGGATENNEDAWGGTPVPYLRSVPDPGAWDFWTKSFTPSTFASLLGFVTVDQVKILGTYVSGAPTGLEVTGTGTSGAKSQVFTGNQFRTKLALKSHYVTGVSGVCQANGADGDDLLLYRGSGSYQVVNVGMSGCVLSQLKVGAWAAGWTHVEAVDLDGDGVDEVLFYRKTDGRYVYYKLNNGSLGTKLADGYWASGWDSVEPLNFNSNTGDELLFYRKSDGRFGYYNLTSQGFIGSAVRIGYFGAGWTSVEPVAIHGDDKDEMLFYRKSDGRFAFYNLTEAGTIGTNIRTGWMAANWGIIEPTDLDGDSTDELVFYRTSDGRYAAYDLNPGGFIGSSLGVGYYWTNLVALTSPAR